MKTKKQRLNNATIWPCTLKQNFHCFLFMHSSWFYLCLWNHLVIIFGHFWVTLCFFIVWLVAHITRAVPWHVGPDTVCPLTPPRCTPSPRPAAQGQCQRQSWDKGPAQSPVDRHGHSPALIPLMKMSTTLKNLLTFQSVGECNRCRSRESSWETLSNRTVRFGST